MSCEEYRLTLMEIARERPVEARREEEALAHAEGCAECAAHLDAERALAAGFRALAGVSAGEEAPARVEAALRRAFVERQARRFRWRWAGAAAAALVMAAASIALVGSRRPERAQARAAEVSSGFIALTYSDAVDAAQPRQLVRMRVPQSTLVSFGIPVPPDRANEAITADVVIGYDGLPRAVRFVH